MRRRAVANDGLRGWGIANFLLLKTFRNFKLLAATFAVVAGRFVLVHGADRVIHFSPGTAEIGRLAFLVPCGYTQPHLHHVVFGYNFRFAAWTSEARAHRFRKLLRAFDARFHMLLHAFRTPRSAGCLAIWARDVDNLWTVDTIP